jgi:PKD repeat protein
MKKTILLFALIVSQAVAALATEVNVNTTLNGAGAGIEVTIYEIVYNPATMDSTMNVFCTTTTNEDGLASCSGNTDASSGYFTVFFTNCEGNAVYYEFYFDAAFLTTFAFAAEYCPEEVVQDCGIQFFVDSLSSDPFNVVLQAAWTGNPISFAWSFGDGGTSSEAYPSYTYATTGDYNVCLTIANEEGCEVTQCVMISINSDGILGGSAQQAFTLNVVEGQLLAVADQNEDATMSVFPNPTADQARVIINGKLVGKADVCVYSISGQQISRETKAISGNQALVDVDLSNYQVGFYMVKVVFENGSSVSQSIIKK